MSDRFGLGTGGKIVVSERAFIQFDWFEGNLLRNFFMNRSSRSMQSRHSDQINQNGAARLRVVYNNMRAALTRPQSKWM